MSDKDVYFFIILGKPEIDAIFPGQYLRAPRPVHGLPRARRRMLWIILSYTLPKISADGAGTGRNGPHTINGHPKQRAIAKFAVMALVFFILDTPKLY
jgi:hypothetical protein